MLVLTVPALAQVRASHPARAPLALAELRQAGAALMFRIDARRLDEVPEVAGPASAPVECMVWNMPFAADIERGQSVKSDPNQNLLRGFFASVVRCVEGWRTSHPCAPSPKVFVTVGIRQFADW